VIIIEMVRGSSQGDNKINEMEVVKARQGKEL